MSEAQDRYQSYLKTDYWQQVSLAVKRRADYRCQLCNSQHNLQAHHRSYQHRGRELEGNNLNDLICLCAACHELFHKRNQISTRIVANEAPKPLGMSWEVRRETLVKVTKVNYRSLKSHKAAWHWMMANGHDLRTKGWRKRAIGRVIPWFCLLPANYRES